MKIHHILIILVFLIVFSAVSATPSNASFTAEYGEYQDDPSNRGFVHDETGSWTATGNTLTVAAGSTTSPPLVLDVDNDTIKDLVVASGNYINIYDSDLSMIDQFNFANAVTSFTFSDDFDSNTYPELHVYSAASDTIYVYEYNSSHFVNKINHTTIQEVTNTSRILCKSTNGEYCFLAVDNGTNDYIMKWNTTWINNTSIGSMNVRQYFPAASDIDRDGRTELVFIADDDGDGNPGIIVLDTNTSTIDGLPYLDTGFSVDGIIDNLATTLESISSPMIYNFNGGGDEEIFLAARVLASDKVRVYVYDATGANFGTFPYDTPDGSTGTADPLITMADIGETNYVVCVFNAHSAAGGNPNEIFECVDVNKNVVVSYNTDFLDTITLPNQGMIAIDVDGDGYDEIVTPRAIYDPTTNTTIMNLTLTNYYISVSDMDADNNVEIMGSRAGSTRIIYSSFTNAPPTLNNSYSYGGYYGYHNPVCVNTTVTYQAQETGGTLTGNYDNDGSSDEERLVTNCGFDDTGSPNTDPLTHQSNGAFTGSNPQFNCYYNTTGTFPVRIYLQDEFNTGDFTQYNTQTISLIVIEGVPGITCNNPGTYLNEVTDQDEVNQDPLGIDEDIEDTLGMFFGTSDRMKTIAGLSIALAIGIAGAQYAGVVGFAGGAIIGLAIVTFIGLIPAWIFILLLISMVLLVIFGKFIVGSNPSQ